MSTPPPLLTFRERLLAWSKQHGRHTLPWQQPLTPYRVWVSEIMLQQTQVRTVIPYFERFMDAFPSIPALGCSSEDHVLALWTGLGYYSRARRLHQASRILGQDPMPSDITPLMALPGIGRSTAGAIRSLGFDQPATIMDGNVQRVLGRHFGVTEPTNTSAGQKRYWALAESLSCPDQPRAYNQAMMDLGALVCTPKKPDCTQCPVQKTCHAHQSDQVLLLPIKLPKKPPREERMLFVWLEQAGRLWLYQRPPSGIWGGLWCLPHQTPSPQATLPHTHRLTHRTLRYAVSHRRLSSHERWALDDPQHAQGAWYTPKEALALALPQPIKVLIAARCSTHE